MFMAFTFLPFVLSYKPHMVYTLALTLILMSSFCSIVYCCRCTTCQVLTLPFSRGNIFLNMIVDINAYDIFLVCNRDVMMTSLIVDSLKRRRANNIFLLAPLLAPTSDEVSVIFFFFFSWFPLFFHILLKNVSDWHNLSMFIHSFYVISFNSRLVWEYQLF